MSAGAHGTCALQPEGRETAQISLDEAERIVLAINERNSRRHAACGHAGPKFPRRSSIFTRTSRAREDGGAAGYPNLDRELGLRRGNLIGLASMGKTSFAINIAENIGVRQELPVAVSSLSKWAATSSPSVWQLQSPTPKSCRKAQLEDEEWNAFSKAVHRLENKPIYSG